MRRWAPRCCAACRSRAPEVQTPSLTLVPQTLRPPAGCTGSGSAGRMARALGKALGGSGPACRSRRIVSPRAPASGLGSRNAGLTPRVLGTALGGSRRGDAAQVPPQPAAAMFGLHCEARQTLTGPRGTGRRPLPQQSRTEQGICTCIQHARVAHLHTHATPAGLTDVTAAWLSAFTGLTTGAS